VATLPNCFAESQFNAMEWRNSAAYARRWRAKSAFGEMCDVCQYRLYSKQSAPAVRWNARGTA
jgi:hypothetical protein